jgi:sugar lactone lactonase YvrE
MSPSRAPARAFLGAVGLLVALAVLPVSTLAAAPSVASSRMLVLFNIDKGQLPENMAPAPGGSLDVVLNGAGEVAQVGPGGRVKVLATLPAPADGGVNTPLLKSAFTAGIVRAPNGTIYTLYNTGTSGQTGVYKIVPGGTPQLIVSLPATSLANELALDTSTHELYISDSALGEVWRAPQAGGTPEVWASGPALAPTAFLGANGLKLHNHAIWVSNTDAGTIVRIPIESGGGAGPISVFASGLATIDDFNFVGSGNEIVAALNRDNQVVLVTPGGSQSLLLDASDGLEGPSSIVVRGNTLYVASAGYFTGQNPNILVAQLQR